MGGSEEIVARNVAGIEELRLPAPREGGVVRIVGANGSGKSHLLRALQAQQTGKAKGIPVRDGQSHASVEGLGTRLVIAARTTLSGELEVEHLGGLDPSAVVAPGIEKPEAADLERIRQLAALAQPEVREGDFRELVGDDDLFVEVVRRESLEKGDLPAVAAAVKRDMEAAARRFEGIAGDLQAQARGLTTGLPADLPEDPIDRQATGRALEERLAALSALRSRAQAMEEALGAAEAAREALATFGDIGTKTDLALVRAEDVAAERRVREAEERLAELRSEREAARTLLLATQQNVERRQALQKAVDAADGLQRVDEAAVREAELAYGRAREAAEQAAVVEAAQGRRAQARATIAKAARAQELGERMRVAARGCEEVLVRALSAVCPEGLSIEGGRLYCEHATRGRILFSELSDGEAYRLMIPAYARALRLRAGENAPCVLVMGTQAAWQELQPAAQRAIVEVAREQRVLVYVAEAEDGPIRAEVLEPEEPS